MSADLFAQLGKFGHVHSEFYPYHEHDLPGGLGNEEHGYRGEDYDATQSHDEDAGIVAPEGTDAEYPATDAVPPAKKKKTKPAVDPLPGEETKALATKKPAAKKATKKAKTKTAKK